MIGGLTKTTSRLAITAAFAAFASTGVMAADLGGNCCSDLEERVAELEATTARKGNRRVSLEVSGHVHEAIMLWDDGYDSGDGGDMMKTMAMMSMMNPAKGSIEPPALNPMMLMALLK